MYTILIMTASYEPRHEKICLRGVRPGRRHKIVCMATEASWRLECGIRERASATLSLHLHDKRIKTAYYIECMVYKRTESFSGDGERGGLVVNASDSGSRGRGSSPTRVKPCCVLKQGTFAHQKYW